jgi:hypothetical protein
MQRLSSQASRFGLRGYDRIANDDIGFRPSQRYGVETTAKRQLQSAENDDIKIDCS